jgi:secreted PhoX family phosphatase
MTTRARQGCWRATRANLSIVVLGAALLCACHKTNNGATLGTKALWIANGANVIEYTPSQFMSGVANAAPHLAINSGVFVSPQGVTFDGSGNLWVVDPGAVVNGAPSPSLFEFSAAQLAALATNNAPDPVATIASASFNFPQQAVFDAAGNLWVSDHNNNTVLAFTAAQVAATGANVDVPVVTLSSPAFNGPLGIIFDSTHNLWVANNGTVPTSTAGVNSAIGTTIVEFAAADVPAVTAGAMATPTLTPNVTLSDDGKMSIQGPWQLNFDSMGNLWASNANPPSTLIEIAVANLATTGAPAPAVTISPVMVTAAMVTATPSLDAPNGLCFDAEGNLAATDSADAFGVPFYGKAQLVTGSPIPDTFFLGTATTLAAPAGCEFGTAVN